MKKILLILLISFCLPSFADVGRRYIYYSQEAAEKAYKKMQKGNYKISRDLKRAYNQYWANDSYYIVKGEFDLYNNDINSAENNFNKAIELLDNNKPISGFIEVCGPDCFAGNRPPDRKYKEIYSESNYYYAYNGLAKVNLAQGNLKTALLYAEDATEAPFYNKDFFNTKDRITEQQNAGTDNNFKSQSINHSIYFERGKSYYDKKKYRAALRDFTNCIEIDSDDWQSYEMLGLIYKTISRYKYDQTAMDMFNKALSINKNAKIALEQKRDLLYETKNYANGIKEVTKTENGKLDISNRLNLIGIHLMDNKKYKEAIAELNKLEVIEKNNGEIYSSLGICYEGLKNYNKALSYYAKALSVKNKDILTYHYRADLYLKMKNYKAALADAQKFKNIEPSDNRTLLIISKAKLALGDYAGALKALNEYTNGYYIDTDELYTVSLIKAKMGATAEAIWHIQDLKSIALGENDTNMYQKAVKLENSLYSPSQINILINVFIRGF